MVDHQHRHLPPAHLEDLVHHLPAHSINVLLLLQGAASCPECSNLWNASQRQPETTSEEHLLHVLGLDPSPNILEKRRRESWDLREVDPEERVPTILRCPVRFRSPVLVVILLDRSRQELRASPTDALELATMAAAVAEHGTRDPALAALALAYAGNVHRSTGRLDLADPYFERALNDLDRAPDPPLWLRAEIRSLQGSLLMDHRHFKDVEVHLLNAAAMFKAAGDPERVVRVRLKLAAFHHLRGRAEQALDVTREALKALNPWLFPQLHLTALHNLTLYLCDAQRATIAGKLLDLVQPLHDLHSSSEARRYWLEGVVSRSLDDLSTAEDCLRRALQQFVDTQCSFLAAFVAVDLAELLLAEGRAEEVVEVTRHLPRLFQSLDVHPEAVAATLLFHKAAAEMKVNEEYVAIFRRFLKRAQVDRSAAFVPPGH